MVSNRTFFLIFLSCVFVNIQGSDAIEGEMLKRGEGFFVLKLSYLIENNVEHIFDEDNQYIIYIVDMRANGVKLNYVLELSALPSFPQYYSIHETTEGRVDYYVYMHWTVADGYFFSRDVFQWWDGRGRIFFEEGYEPHTYTYEIRRGMEFLEITYRIMLPYPTLTIQNLRDPNYENKIFTEEYRMIVDIRHIFERSNR